VLSERSGSIEHFLNLSFAEQVKRPPPAQPSVWVDRKDILHPFVVVGESQQHLF
jgi:hypothetical protein